MHLPIQSQPVQRTIVGQRNASRGDARGGANNAIAGDQGVRPSEHGVQPSFDFTSLLPIATTLLSLF